MRKFAIVGAALGLGVLAACSSQAAPAPPQVASVQTSDAAQPSSAAPSPQGQPERPRFRIDMTDDERDALYNPYRKCMGDHGMGEALARRGDPAVKPDRQKQEAAAKACDPLLPLPAWENDINNPEAFDFNRRVVTCLRDKGVKYVDVNRNEETGIVGPSFGGPQNDQESIKKGLELASKCEQEVANGGYK